MLRAGEEHSIELDMPEARCARLHGTVLVSGKPFKGGLQLRGEVGVMPNGEPRMDYRNARTDAKGTFEVLLAPGAWKVGPWVKMGKRGLTVWAPQVVRVVSGEKTQASFDARITTTKLRVLAPDGKPVVGLHVRMQRDGVHLETDSAPTDADGRTSVMSTPGMAVPVFLPRSLMTPEKQREFYQQHLGDPMAMERMLVKLPPILFTEHAKPEVEMRLPAEWDR